jgi:hypothetical protein
MQFSGVYPNKKGQIAMGKSIKTIQDTRMARCQGVATLWDLFDVRCIIRLKNLKNRLRNVRNVQSISEIMDFT